MLKRDPVALLFTCPPCPPLFLPLLRPSPRSYWNVKGLQWKTYRRGELSGPLCDGCTFISTPELPGGDGLVELRHTNFLDGSGVRINYHCNAGGTINPSPHSPSTTTSSSLSRSPSSTASFSSTGGLCASHYLISGEKLPAWVLSEASVQTSALVTVGGTTRYLAGSLGAHVAFDSSGCEAAGEWVSCPNGYGLRTLKIYSPNRGGLSVRADGVTVTVPFRDGGRAGGPAAYGGSLVLPACEGPAGSDCANYMWPGATSTSHPPPPLLPPTLRRSGCRSTPTRPFTLLPPYSHLASLAF